MQKAPPDLTQPALSASADLSIPSVVGTYLSVAKTLAAFADNHDSKIEFSTNAAGNILINGGAVHVIGGTPTVTNTNLITAFGLGGNDVITLDESHGALPNANLFGGDGNDTITGGSGADQIFGQAGNDTLVGRGGNDLLFGGAGNDVLTGGAGSDQMFGEAGNDRMVWNPGDGSDLIEGGAGTDTAEVNGGNGAETFVVAANGSRVSFDRTDGTPFHLDIGTTENITINANGGDDVITAGNGLGALTHLTIDGGAGNDTINGGDGDDTLSGGTGNDFIDGNRGNDTVFLGAGDDVFQWDPGDGSDTVEGGAGQDTMLFNGANVSERIDISANGGRLRFTRDVANITMDTNGVESVHFRALGGNDTITVGDLHGTGVTDVSIDLAGFGGTAGDAQVDSVIVNGSNSGENIQVTATADEITVNGLAASVSISHTDTQDVLAINGLGGNDTINAGAVPAAAATLTLDGGAGDDTITGGQGADTLIGGEGNDVINGHQGNDVAFLGAGNDTFIWNPGDGSDTVEGGDGLDKLVFNGSNAGENMDISANGGRVRLFRDVGNITMDVSAVEHFDVTTIGGADTITVGDLTGTGAQQVHIDIGGIPGQTGDGQVDHVNVNGSAAADAIVVGSGQGEVFVTGLAAETHVVGGDADGSDQLQVNGLGGDDNIDASGLHAGLVTLNIAGGQGNDVIHGSQGGDFINGGAGTDTAFMGAGDDVFTWNPGDGSDTVEGQQGLDTLLFNGSNVGEKIDISANGERLRFFRDVANVTMDTHGVESVHFNALGGADTITVGDLRGTDVSDVSIDLAGTLGGGVGDAQADNVIANGTSEADAIVVVGDGSGIQVFGLSAHITVTGAEGANDTVTVNALGGDDVIDASGFAAGTARLVLDGGAGDDVIIGSAGDDTLIGGAGDDVIIGGGGNDVIVAAPGDDIIIQDFTTSQDHIDLSGRGVNFEWLMANATDVHGDTVLDLGDQHITLQGVSVSGLHQGDFLV